MNRVYPTIPTYNKYIGRPLYKFSRKYLGNSKLLGLEIADLPASLIIGGLGALISIPSGIALAIGHQTYTPIWLYNRHKANVKERKEKQKSLETPL